MSKIKGVNKNVKLNLITEAILFKDDKRYDFDDPLWHHKYFEASNFRTSRAVQVLNILQILETREIFGLTYRDLMDMDAQVFDYACEKIKSLSEARIEKQRIQEMKDEQRGH